MQNSIHVKVVPLNGKENEQRNIERKEQRKNKETDWHQNKT